MRRALPPLLALLCVLLSAGVLIALIPSPPGAATQGHPSTTPPPTTTPPPSAELEVDKADTPDPVTALEDVAYVITVTNTGGEPATGVEVVDTLPAGTTFSSASPDQGSCSEAAAVVTCDFGTLGPGEDAAVTIAATTPNDPGVITNSVDASADNAATVSATEDTLVEAQGEDDDSQGYFDGSGGEISTGIMATSGDTTVTTVVVPVGVVGVVTIVEGPGDAGDTPGGVPFGDRITLEMPKATAENPYLFTFTIDTSVLPPGSRLNRMGVWIDDVHLPRCDNDFPHMAVPDPCLFKKKFVKSDPPGTLDLKTWVLASVDPIGRHGAETIPFP